MKRGPEQIDETESDGNDGDLKKYKDHNRLTPAFAHQIAPVYQNPAQVGLALYNFAEIGNFFAVQTLISQYKNDIPYGYKGWALSKAAENGHTAVVRYLLNHTGNQMHPRQIQFAFDTAMNAHRNESARVIADYQEFVRTTFQSNNVRPR